MRDLARRHELDAIPRAHLELHLKRCESCQVLKEQLDFVEAGPGEGEPFDSVRQQAVYNRLIPVVNEVIASQSALRKRRRFLPVWVQEYGLLGLGACAASIMAVLTFWPADSGAPSKAEMALSSSQDTLAGKGADAFALSSTVDTLEGTVTVNGRSGETLDQFQVKTGTKIATAPNSQMGFRIGDTARVALMGEGQWEVTRLSPTAIGMRLQSGRLAVEFDGTIGQTLEVETPDSLVRVKGTVFTVEVLEVGGTRVGVVEGLVEVVPKRGSNLRPVELSADQSCAVPGSGEVMPIDEEQRALSAGLSDKELGKDEGTRLVRFDGSPEQVKVEVDGRVVGVTPLMVRVPSGNVTYRLSAPGMEPVDGTLDNEGENQVVVFAMEPAADFGPEGLEIVRVADPPPRPTVHPLKKDAPKAVFAADHPRWDLFLRAKSAVAAGDLKYAIGLLERAVNEVSGEKRMSSLMLLAECRAAVGDYVEAANTYQKIVELSSGAGEGQNARYEVGRLAMDKLGDMARARAAFTAYLASSRPGPLREDAYYSLCEVSSKEGNHSEALHCFNEFLRAFPGGHREADARLWRGALYQQDSQRKWADAERDLHAFIRTKPNHPRAEEARYRLVIGRYKLGDERGALRMIDEYNLYYPTGMYKARLAKVRSALTSSGRSDELP
ncbi:MAG: tetratricopeptide repeat protein [Myxococcota bacterium]|jgi:tetratricopeptide (TPR) repeat protein|nr:tetratricopeptide repeat protein [Myxococcota bacterium]